MNLWALPEQGNFIKRKMSKSFINNYNNTTLNRRVKWLYGEQATLMSLNLNG